MKVLYFDCSSGICGNMVLGALLDIIDDEEYFLKVFQLLKRYSFLAHLKGRNLSYNLHYL